MSFWVFLDENWKKRLRYLKSATLEYAEMQKIVQNKQTKSILGPKLPYLDILGSKFEKVLSYLISASSKL